MVSALLLRRYAHRVATWARRLELIGVAVYMLGSVVGVYAAFGPGVGSGVGKVGAIVLLLGAWVYLIAALLQRRVSRITTGLRH